MATDLVALPIPGAMAPLDPARWEVVAGAWLAGYGSANTRGAYRRDLTTFAGWLAALGVGSPLEATRPAIDAWARALEVEGLSPATRARRLAAVASFYSYAAAEGVLDRSPAAAVRRPKVAADSPRLGMTSTEARALLEVAERGTPTDRALVALCFLAGLRVSEALALHVGHLRTEAGHRVAVVHGKGGTVATVPLSPHALRLLTDALEVAGSSGPIIRGADGGSIDRHKAGRIIAALGRSARIGHRLRPHDLRHACATLALEAGAPLHRVQDLLRHASPTTTQRYTAHRDRLDGSAAYTLAALVAGGVAA